MLFSVLAKTMEERFSCRPQLADTDPELTHFTFLTPGLEPTCRDCLYVEHGSRFGSEIHPAALLTFCDDDMPREAENVICVEEKYFTECLNLLTGCFFEEQKREEAFNQLVPVPSDRRSLHEMIDLAAVFLERSLVLINLSFHVIAASKTVSVTDKIWMQNISRGYCTYEFIRAINQLLPDNAMAGATDAFFVNCSASPENKLCCYIYYENQPIGYLILLDNEKGIQPYHLQYLPRISQLISATLRNLPDF